MDDISVYTNTILSTLLVVGVVDNFYDLLKATSSLVVDQVGKQLNNKDDEKTDDS